MKNVLTSLKSFIEKCKRVWMVLKKPTKQEFITVAKVSAVGILIIGLLGFIISIIMKLFVR
ncbi:protein translocase SEC61 complex subunit gamma [Candidatus Pacearchaeota archaeon]|nr:protein translocase SEC61 complex subunit gamma [Candidatus Pacearchaeota archaeon]